MKEGVDYIGVGLGALIQNEEGQILLMRRGPTAKNERGSWALPGGTLDFGETLQEGIKRETREELGIEIAITGMLPAFDHIIQEESQHWVTNIFLAKITEGIPKILEPEKCDTFDWFFFDELPSPMAAMTRGWVDYFRKRGIDKSIEYAKLSV